WLAFRRFGIWSTAPLFVPLGGGLVITRARARGRRAYAWCVLAGPAAGVAASGLAVLAAAALGSPAVRAIAWLGALMTPVTRLPLPGLDGAQVGRAARDGAALGAGWAIAATLAAAELAEATSLLG